MQWFGRTLPILKSVHRTISILHWLYYINYSKQSTRFRTESETHPCCVLSQVAATVLYSVGVAQLLEELYFLDDVLPFLKRNKKQQPQSLMNTCDWCYITSTGEGSESCQVLPHWTACHYRTSSWWPPPHWCGYHEPDVESWGIADNKSLFFFYIKTKT